MNISLNNNNKIHFGESLNACKTAGKENLVVPIIALASSVITSGGYLLGSAGLYFDTYKNSKGKIKNILLPEKETKSSQEGVKTIVPDSDFAKVGLTGAKVGIAASALSGIAAGITTGMPLLSIGDTIAMAAAPQIETPIGTGLFGIGIASIFSGLALENTPELLLDKNKFKAAKTLSAKTALVFQNIKSSLNEVGKSCFELVKNILFLFIPKQHNKAVNFFRENIFSFTPKSVIFKESINKDGKVFIEKMLKRPKNYLMHAASVILALGGTGVVLFSLINNKKAQKNSLAAEEAGFFADNIGMTRYGVDKLSIAKSLKDNVGGVSYTTGGIINGVSQIIGLDNKQGRAAQWLGIGLVFIGYGFDRAKHLKKVIKNNKFPKEITETARQWEVDLTNIFNIKNRDGKKLFKQTVNAIKKEKEIPHSPFKVMDEAFNSISGSSFTPEKSTFIEYLGTKLPPKLITHINFIK